MAPRQTIWDKFWDKFWIEIWRSFGGLGDGIDQGMEKPGQVLGQILGQRVEAKISSIFLGGISCLGVRIAMERLYRRSLQRFAQPFLFGVRAGIR